MSTDYKTFCENAAKNGKIQIYLCYQWGCKNHTLIGLSAFDGKEYFRQDIHVHTRLMKVKPFKKNDYYLDKTKFDRVYNNFQKLKIKRNFKKHLNKVLKYAIEDPQNENEINLPIIAPI